MASNGLVGNAKKTVFMMLNNPAKENDSKLSIIIVGISANRGPD